ncbi:thiol reductant ABC exporter subunit CydD [Nocardioides sp. CER19]|uniref:thiol reductant ABC exporter subunit CydD n=1 Tax=Nocardioides sp. CER19 TaxID=3038538 RepID=UPI002446D88D|nr:thiol reductant ABC exporter subunit CydD [Nocardioides sp. CER19]MDH2414871.1 thiol reductant ABC exporter subunit CydD [Nocardioides sp. CER19]
MRPTDPAVRRQLAVATRPLAVVLLCGVVGALLLVGQAWAVTELIIAALHAEPLTAWAALVVGVFAARALVGWASDVAAARAAALVGADVRRGVVRAALSSSLPGSSGSVTALATRGAAATEPYLTRYVPALVLAGVLPFLVVVAIAVLDPLSGVIVLATLPLIPVFGILVGLATRDRAESQWRAMADLAGHFLDVMRGLPTLVAFRRARAQSSVIAAVTDRYRRRTLRTLRIAFASSAVLELVATISVALVAVTVGLRLASGSLSLQTALVVLLLAPEAYWPLRRVGAEFHAAAEGAATFSSVAETRVVAPRLPGSRPSTSGLSPVEFGVVAPRDPESCPSVALEGVSVTYPGRSVPALAPITLSVPSRGVTAIVGPSGCGKSTLLAVVAGLLPPTTGYADLPAPDRIALLPQRPVFLAGTVAENLRLARPDATDDELRAVLARVALDHRVELGDQLGEDGLTLSAGERARLALARVVLSDRPWVLLDEPTAHLDADTERVIADTVAELGRSRAVVLVAHRPALVALADHVVELRPVVDGRRQAGSRGATTPVSRGDKPDLEGREPGSRGATTRISAVLGGLASTAGVALTATAGWLIVQASYQPAVLTLLVAIVGVRTFGIARPALRYAERLLSHDSALRLLAARRVQVFDAVVPLTPGRLGKRRGDVLAAIVDDVDAVLDRELRVRLPVRSFVVTAVVATAVTALLDARAAAVVVALCGVGGVAYALARAGARTAERRAVTARAAVSERVAEAVQATTELRVWQAEERAVARVDEAGRDLAAATVASATWLGLARALVLLAAGAGVAATTALVTGEVGGPILALLALTPLALAEPVGTLADAGAVAARTAAAEGRLHDLETRDPAVSDPASPAEPDGSAVRGRELAVSWGERRVLDGLDLTLAPGERVGITGPSGSGKSTLASLMLRFVDPDAGELRLGTRPMRSLALDDVRRTIGLVDDDPHVFASNVVENVRLARPGAGDADVEAALRKAHLGGWLDDLPEGLGTRLGDGGAQVSGGERARLAIARSLLAGQDVLVLDEPTAHLDTATAEALAREVLQDEDRSILWITHETSGLDLVDRVVELAGEER